MRPDAAIQIFEEVGAIRHGHFELTSGLHSGTYVQCALVLQYPKYAEQLGRALAAEFMDLRVDCVASRSCVPRRQIVWNLPTQCGVLRPSRHPSTPP